MFKFGFSRAISSPVRVLPDFIIIGAAKCGTTSLYDNLIQHPNVYSASRKEIHYFDLNRTGWYRSNFPTIFFKNRMKKLLKFFITGEATPNYLFFPDVPKKIFEVCPLTKFIVLLRNPIDRAYSHYQHQTRKKLVTAREKERETLSFEDAVKTEERRLEGEWEKISKDKSYPTEKFRNFSYLSRGVYVDQLERWFKIFPREQFLILKTENFYKDQQTTLNNIFDFLKIPHYKIGDLKKLNVGNYKEMDTSVRKYLFEYFKPHNEKLSKILGKEFFWD